MAAAATGTTNTKATGTVNNRKQKVRRRLARCEKYIVDSLQAISAGEPDRVEENYEAEFAQPLRELAAMLRRGGITLTPGETARLVRLDAFLSHGAGVPSITQAVIQETLADLSKESQAADVRTVAGAEDIDPALLAELLDGPTRYTPKGTICGTNHPPQGQETAGPHEPDSGAGGESQG